MHMHSPHADAERRIDIVEPEKEKNIAKMPAEFIGKACCGGDKKWGDGRGAGRAPNILTTTLPRLRQTPSENAD